MEKTELKHWRKTWALKETLIYRQAAYDQVNFVINKICGNLLKCKGFVVSHHTSKSCKLPVYFIKLRNGIRLTMRCNFYDWKLSVEIPEEYASLPTNYLPEDCLSYDLVQNKIDKISPCYCEGFKKEWCYDAYDPQLPPKKFTIEIPDDERLYVIIHYLKHAYPDVTFNPKDDKRTVDELKSDIEKILDAHGFNDWKEETNCEGKVSKYRVMNAWEILRRTYCIMDEYPYSEEIRKVFGKSMCISNDPQRYAEVIKKFPEIHKEFLMEEWMYND